MRESNHNLPAQNRASIVISNALYDRRAFDSPISTLPLVSSLHHLGFLTSTSPRIREILTVDGGLERLVRIAEAGIELAHTPNRVQCTCAAASAVPTASSRHQPLLLDAPIACACTCQARRVRGPRFKAFSAYSKRPAPAGASAYDRALLMTYTLSLQSLVNVGVRGSEHIRTRVVQAGVLGLAVRVLKGFLAERARQAQELADAQDLAFRAARSTARMRVMSLLNTPVAEVNLIDFPAPEPEADGVDTPLPAVTRTPTPDTAALISDADTEAAAAEEREQDRRDAEDDAELEDSVAQDDAPTRSAVIKANPSPPAEIIHAVVEDDDAMEVDEASPAESGDSDGDADGDGDMAMNLQVPGTATAQTTTPVTRRSESAHLAHIQTTRPLRRASEPPLELPFAAFEASPTTPQINLVSPSLLHQQQSFTPSFRFREDDALLCLQLLAYLSKYPHIRSVFHSPDRAYECTAVERPVPFPEPPADHSKNVFSLVERFTVRPSPSDRLAPRFPSEISYWSGVVMRNACRKDESRGGIRQCANMACGAWERYAREFAKCRRCRKAKYCSKQCQSKAWQSGHRFWCSAREPSEHHHSHAHESHSLTADGHSSVTHASPARATSLDRAEDDDDDALVDGVPPRPTQPRQHILLRGTILPEMTAPGTGDEDLLLAGPAVNVATLDPFTRGGLAEDVEEAVGRFF